MTIANLPLKYRPQTFEDLVGQSSITKYLSALIFRGQVRRNLIISGAYGSGKTSAGRIYARGLNCLAPTALGSPCNVCEHCRLFFENQFPDYLEVDGATRGRVDQIKNLIDVAITPPMYGKYRVIVIDESQAVSKQGFDALLKLVEEPPPFLVFIFTTTELHKVREAVRSRCQKLEVKLLDHATSVAYLEKIAKLENLSYELPALELLAYLSKGHTRDLLTNLEQTSYLSEISLENVKLLFSLGYITALVRIVRSLFLGDYNLLISELRGWSDTPSKILDILKEFFLYLSYTQIFKMNIQLNPIFGFIPVKEIATIMAAFNARISDSRITAEEGMDSLISVLAKSSVQSPICLELLIFEVFNLVHQGKFKVASFGSLSIDTPLPKVERKVQGPGLAFLESFD